MSLTPAAVGHLQRLASQGLLSTADRQRLVSRGVTPVAPRRSTSTFISTRAPVPGPPRSGRGVLASTIGGAIGGALSRLPIPIPRGPIPIPRAPGGRLPLPIPLPIPDFDPFGCPKKKRRRMNVTNVKALRRAMRRVEGFAKLSKRTIRFTRTVRRAPRKKC